MSSRFIAPSAILSCHLYDDIHTVDCTFRPSSKHSVAIQPDAKGMVPEDLQGFIGLYWGAVSWPCVCEAR
eukprot:302798-Pelagomonas_calceolata.AAC.2